MHKVTSIILFVISLTFLMGQTAHAEGSKIGILVYDGFLTSDVTAPIEVFGTASKRDQFSNYEVVIISATSEKLIRSEEGMNIVADTTIYQDIVLDVLIVPSAYEMKPTLSNTDLIAYIKKQSHNTSWMASNCSGAFLLAEAGALDGKQATTWAGGEEIFAHAYPNVEVIFDQNTVIDDGVITSNGGPVSYQAAFELLTKLSSKQFSEEISDAIQFGRLKTAFK